MLAAVLALCPLLGTPSHYRALFLMADLSRLGGAGVQRGLDQVDQSQHASRGECISDVHPDSTWITDRVDPSVSQSEWSVQTNAGVTLGHFTISRARCHFHPLRLRRREQGRQSKH